MKGLMTFGMAIAAVLALAACGGRGSSGAASSAAGSDTSSTTVSVRQLSGVGSVLVDHTGKALYSSDLEAGGKIVCDDAACTAFWKPLTVGGGMQVTINAKPLYTFSEDSPGKATGDGFTDDFGGHHFTWNVVRAGGTTTSGAGSGSGGGAPSSTGGSGGSPGYCPRSQRESRGASQPSPDARRYGEPATSPGSESTSNAAVKMGSAGGYQSHAICGPTSMTSGTGCSAQSGGSTPCEAAAIRAKRRSSPAGVQTSK